MLPALLLYILSTYHPPVVVYANADTGFGKCMKMNQHFHNDDGFCHRDSDDSPVLILPKVS